MKSNSSTVYLKDYRPPAYRIWNTRMELDLDFHHTRIRTIHQIKQLQETPGPLVLDFEDIEIKSILINGCEPTQGTVTLDDCKLSITGLLPSSEIEIVNTLNPSQNSKLEGLYHSDSMLSTQCEAEGFRRITPAIDRPDNLATYQVLLRGDKEQFPVLLCNGNCVRTEVHNGVHETEWHDLFPKPTYLFAIVAGNLACLKDTFLTCSGREVALYFYATEQDIGRCAYAMDALQRAMRWDEDTYGREYDLDLYNIVAVKHFNMGAMENKSLNVFNTKYVLAEPDVSTDLDVENVERVIAHEYFHNWSGNRVTCRDWFQLSLKEGLTVFREQSFCADMNSSGVQRIDEVKKLRSFQFAEDASPLAHPVRPDKYQEINNFYTTTVYEKGAEVVRMMRTLVGDEAFRRGTDIYFHRHDGQAVTTDDFVAAIRDGAGDNADFDFDSFKRWYCQAGTPTVNVVGEHDPKQAKYILTLQQHCPPTPGQPTKLPFVIPVVVSLLDPDGQLLPLTDGGLEQRLILSESKQQFVFDQIQKKPVPSLLRRFSAPVKLEAKLNAYELGFLFRHDSDPFNRWDAGQRLFQQAILDNLPRIQSDQTCRFNDAIIDLAGSLLKTPGDDLKLASKLLTLPDEAWLGELSKPTDPISIAKSRLAMMQQIATTFHDPLMDRYQSLQSVNQAGSETDISGARALRDKCLEYLITLDTKEVHELARTQLADAKDLTDRSSALKAISNSSMHDRQSLLNDFYQSWKNETLVVDHWLRVQATARQTDVLNHVQSLTKHPCFDQSNPNRVYSLLLGYAMLNFFGFHRTDGKGYHLIADWVLKIDPYNPMVAARLISTLTSWPQLISAFKKPMKSALVRISKTKSLSPDVSETVSRALDPNLNTP